MREVLLSHSNGLTLVVDSLGNLTMAVISQCICTGSITLYTVNIASCHSFLGTREMLLDHRQMTLVFMAQQAVGVSCQCQSLVL